MQVPLVLLLLCLCAIFDTVRASDEVEIEDEIDKGENRQFDTAPPSDKTSINVEVFSYMPDNPFASIILT